MRRFTIWTATVGRDQGKIFGILEKSAYDAEWWATRAFLALAKNGVEVPEEISSMGLAGLAQVGIKSLTRLDPYDAKPLLDEMMTCVSFVPDPSRIDPATGRSHTRPLVEDDIEEISTVTQLRMEIFSLHVNFSIADALSSLKSASEDQTSSTTKTSPAA